MSHTEKPIEERIYNGILDVFKSVSYDDILFQQAYLNEVTSVLCPYTNKDRHKIKTDIKKSDLFYYNKINNLFKLKAGITYEKTIFSDSKKRILTVSFKNLKTPSLNGGFKFRIKAFNVSCTDDNITKDKALMLFKHEFKSSNPTLSYKMKKARKILNASKYFEEVPEISYVPTEVDLTIEIDLQNANMTVNGKPYEECYDDKYLNKMMNFISTDYLSILKSIFPYGLEGSYHSVMNKLPDKVNVFNKLYSMVIYISNKKHFTEQNRNASQYNDFSYEYPLFKEFKERGHNQQSYRQTVKAIKNKKLTDFLNPKYTRAFYLSIIEFRYKSVNNCFKELQKMINFLREAKDIPVPKKDKYNQKENDTKFELKKESYRKNFILPIFPQIVKNRSELIKYLNEERFNDFTQIRNNLYRPRMERFMNDVKEGVEKVPTNLKEYEKHVRQISYSEYTFNKNYEMHNKPFEVLSLTLVESSLIIGSKNMADILYHYLYQDKNILETSQNDGFEIRCYIKRLVDIFSNYRFRKDNEYYLEENIKIAPYNTSTGYNVDKNLKDEYKENQIILNQFSYYYFADKNISYVKVYERLCKLNSTYIRSLIDSNNWPNTEPLLAEYGFREDRKEIDPKIIKLVPKLNIPTEYITEYPVKEKSESDTKNKLHPKFIDVFDKKSNKYLGSIYLRTTDSNGSIGKTSSSIFIRSEGKKYFWDNKIETSLEPLYLYRFGMKPASDIISKYVYNNDVQFTITYNKPKLVNRIDGSSDFYYQIRGNEYYDEFLPAAYSNIDSFYFIRENGKMVSVKSHSYQKFNKFSEVKLTKVFPTVYKDLIENKIIEIKREF